MPAEKRCSKCHQIKLLSEFCKDKKSRDGLSFWCKQCRLDNAHNYKNRDREHYRKLRRISRAKWGLTPRGRYTILKGNAKKTRFPHITFTSAEFVQWLVLQGNSCHYCGIQLTNSSLTKSNIDRRDNNKGFTLDNMVLSCKKCNIIKSSWFTESEMLEIVNKYLKPKMSLPEGR